jgi:hypothetical protein
VFGSDAHSADRSTGPAEGETIQNGAQMGVLAQVVKEQFVPATEELVTTYRFLLAACSH